MVIPLELIIYILSGVVLALVLWIAYLEWRLKKLMRGRSGANLEQIIDGLGKELNIFQNRHTALDKYLEGVEIRLRGSIQHVHTVRFNPFADKGGNHSFATALLDEHGNGVVISTLAAREKVNVFAKPVEAYTSSYELTDEEREAIARKNFVNP